MGALGTQEAWGRDEDTGYPQGTGAVVGTRGPWSTTGDPQGTQESLGTWRGRGAPWGTRESLGRWEGSPGDIWGPHGALRGQGETPELGKGAGGTPGKPPPHLPSRICRTRRPRRGRAAGGGGPAGAAGAAPGRPPRPPPPPRTLRPPAGAAGGAPRGCAAAATPRPPWGGTERDGGGEGGAHTQTHTHGVTRGDVSARGPTRPCTSPVPPRGKVPNGALVGPGGCTGWWGAACRVRGLRGCF